MTKSIAILTSSRADYGIYKPLIQSLASDASYEITIIAFGMHLLKKYGTTVDEIREDNLGEILTVDGLRENDSEKDITFSYGSIIQNFSSIWDSRKFDLIFALGDRFEMSAAVQSTIPYRLKLAHIHGGETTLGAIDNIYRHQITLASDLHFPSTDAFAEKISNLTGKINEIFSVGSISLDGIVDESIPEWSEVANIFKIPLNKEFVLVTFHPETAGDKENSLLSEVIYDVLETISKDIHVVITMPNADTDATAYRNQFKTLKSTFSNRFSLVESFGRLNYFSAMKNSKYLLGNTSSGIIEAASFKKFVVNVGERQKGRLQSDNVFDSPFDKEAILRLHRKIMKLSNYSGENVYYKRGSVKNIMKILNEELH